MCPIFTIHEMPEAVILCGGLGTRLSSVVSDKPKALAEVAGKPFLDILISHLANYGFKRVILSVGHLKEQIISRYEKNKSDGKFNCRIDFSEEDSPRGTGGAVKRAEKIIASDSFIVMNGDTFFRADFSALLQTHREKKALLSMILAKITDGSDCGSVELDRDGRVVGFREKMPGAGEKIVSAGIYAMSKSIFEHMPDAEKFSLEQDIFPKLAAYKPSPCFGRLMEGELLDIGTPERYEKANRLFAQR